MGTLFSGVGLVSGLDIQGIVDRLMAIEARPRDMLQARISNIDAQRTAYLDISARISAVLSRVSALGQRATFLSATANSSLPDVLSATASESAAPGAYSFIVRALASSQQSVSRGFPSASSQLAAGTFTLESAKARVDNQTRLGELNGYAGVQRGSIKLTDAAGTEKVVNINDALTLGEVVQRINDAGLNVRAEVRDDGLVLTETTGGTIRIGEVDGGRTAADLGFGPGQTYSTAGTLSGGTLMTLSERTPLSALNDGNGVSLARAGGDFTINGVTVDLSTILKPETRFERLNHGAGVTLGRIRLTTVDAEGDDVPLEIDLSDLRTIGDVKATIEQAVPGVSVTITDGKLIVGYAANGDGKKIKVEDVTGSAARDLGIAGESTTGRVTGRQVLFNDTLGDVLAAINHADFNEGNITARLEGTHVVIDAGGPVELASLGTSGALEGLGITAGTFDGPAAGRRVLGGLDTVLLQTLNGGNGIQTGLIELQAGGTTLSLDLTGVETLQGAVDRINSAARSQSLAVEAAIDATGTRLNISSLDGTTPISLRDLTGNFAQLTGLTGSGPSLRGANLQRQYISEATTLASLNNGRGVGLGSIKITNSAGRFATIDLPTGSVRTLGDVIERINSANIGVEARINDTGDGLVLVDSAGGTQVLKVEEAGGTAARDLNLLGESRTGTLDGSFELRVETGGNITLQDVVNRINASANGLATATILNDGSGASPFRLQLTARNSGSAGEFVLDAGATGLDFSTLSRAQDARVLLGSNPQSGVLVTSSTNTLTDVMPGLTLGLVGVSDTPVTVTVAHAHDRAIEALDGFVSGFNEAVERLRELSKYDPETERAAILFGESVLQSAESRLFRAVTGSLPQAASGSIQRLSQIGIRLSGGELTFDQAKFEETYANDPQAVIEFFTAAERGVAASLKEQFEALTKTDGLIDRRADSLDHQKDDLGKQIERLSVLLDSKRQRLLRQYQAMESALSQLQAQQAALGQLSALSGPSAPGAGR